MPCLKEKIKAWFTIAGSNAEVGQLIACMKFVKKRCQTWHRLFSGRMTRCHVWDRFFTPYLASKSWQYSFVQSLAQLRQTSPQFDAFFKPPLTALNFNINHWFHRKIKKNLKNFSSAQYSNYVLYRYQYFISKKW